MDNKQIVSIFEQNNGAKCIITLNSGDSLNNVIIGKLNFSPTKPSAGIGIELLDEIGKGLVLEISRISDVVIVK